MELLYTAKGTLPGRAGSRAMAQSPAQPAMETASARDELQTLLRLVDGALARTRVHQLMTLSDQRNPADPSGAALLWNIEIPLPRDGGFDALRIRMEESPGAEDQGTAQARCWRVMLCLDCASLGPLHALVELSGQRIGTTLWAEREGTLLAARAALGELEASLRAQGVEVSRVECLPGRPQELPGARFGSLLDVRT